MPGFSGSGGITSATSAELVVVSAQAASALSQELSVRVAADVALSAAINVVSNALSQLQSVHDVLSNRVSANSAAGGGTGSVTSAEYISTQSIVSVGRVGFRAIVKDVQQIQVSTIVNVSGLSLPIAAGGVYEVMGTIMYTPVQVSAGPGIGFGLSFPAMDTAGGAIVMYLSAVSSLRAGVWDEDSSGSIVVSSLITAIPSRILPVNIQGVLVPNTSGTLQVIAKGNTGATAPWVLIHQGSYIRAFRIG